MQLFHHDYPTDVLVNLDPILSKERTEPGGHPSTMQMHFETDQQTVPQIRSLVSIPSHSTNLYSSLALRENTAMIYNDS
jgi:hypothetical protein